MHPQVPAIWTVLQPEHLVEELGQGEERLQGGQVVHHHDLPLLHAGLDRVLVIAHGGDGGNLVLGGAVRHGEAAAVRAYGDGIARAVDVLRIIPPAAGQVHEVHPGLVQGQHGGLVGRQVGGVEVLERAHGLARGHVQHFVLDGPVLVGGEVQVEELLQQHVLPAAAVARPAAGVPVAHVDAGGGLRVVHRVEAEGEALRGAGGHGAAVGRNVHPADQVTAQCLLPANADGLEDLAIVLRGADQGDQAEEGQQEPEEGGRSARSGRVLRSHGEAFRQSFPVERGRFLRKGPGRTTGWTVIALRNGGIPRFVPSQGPMGSTACPLCASAWTGPSGLGLAERTAPVPADPSTGGPVAHPTEEARVT